MNKFKKGDRIAAYYAVTTTPSMEYYKYIRRIGTVKGFKGDLVAIEHDNIEIKDTYYHYKTCRKLVKKPKRRAFVHKSFYETFTTSTPLVTAYGCDVMLSRSTHGSLSPGEDYIEFIEVKKK